MVLSSGCLREEIRTVVVEVPGMKAPECAKIIQDALGQVDGIMTASPDMDALTMTVTYDSSKLAQKNVEFIITGVGFEANSFPPQPFTQTGLPEGCR